MWNDLRVYCGGAAGSAGGAASAGAGTAGAGASAGTATATALDGISTGGPEPLVTDFKSLQGVFTTMIQGVMLDEGGSIDDLVKQASADLAEVK